MSYAIIQTGGKQYKVKAGEILKIERLEESKPEVKIEFKEILAYDGDVKNTFCLTFEIEYEAFYQKFKYNLKKSPEYLKRFLDIDKDSLKVKRSTGFLVIEPIISEV